MNREMCPTAVMEKGEEKAIDMDAFCAKVMELIKKRKDNIQGANHLTDFYSIENVNELTKADAQMFELVLEKEILPKREEIDSYKEDVSRSGSSSREFFAKAIGNKLGILSIKKEIEALKRRGTDEAAA